MVGGRTYPFVLSFTNPMYDPINIRLNILRSPLPTTTAGTDEPGTAQQEKRRPPFAITLPTHTFSVAAFAEAWEYDEEDDDDMVEDEHADSVDGRRRVPTSTTSGTTRSGKVKTVGVLERKANTTYIGGEVVIGKEAQGDLKVRGISESPPPLLNALCPPVSFDGNFHISERDGGRCRRRGCR